MSEVIRVFVEKRPGFDGKARQLWADLRDNLGLSELEDVKIVNRYDLSGLSREEYQAARDTVLSEPNVDLVYEEEYPLPQGYRAFAIEYLPGQYDQRADSAAQCIQLLTQRERPRVATAELVAVKGLLQTGALERIRDYLVNPVDSRLASLDKPETLDSTTAQPSAISRVNGLTAWDEGRLFEFHRTMGFAMSREDLLFCRDYFKNEEKRDPTVTELRVIDTYWSDDCRHTTFLTSVERRD